MVFSHNPSGGVLGMEEGGVRGDGFPGLTRLHVATLEVVGKGFEKIRV